jgi:hypothetical protein
MPLWLRKLVVVFITVFTLGLVTPPAHLLDDSDSASKTKADFIKPNANSSHDSGQSYQLTTHDTGQDVDYQLSWPEIAASLSENEELNTHFLDYIQYHADELTMIKFGERIQNRLADEYMNEISPKIHEVVAAISNELSTDTIRNLTISNNPSSGYGEKIFHIYDVRDGNDKFRFHVRREHPPQDGYWFSFHYHTDMDDFQSHNNLGKLYWDKNMPPKWMA